MEEQDPWTPSKPLQEWKAAVDFRKIDTWSVRDCITFLRLSVSWQERFAHVYGNDLQRMRESACDQLELLLSATPMLVPVQAAADVVPNVTALPFVRTPIAKIQLVDHESSSGTSVKKRRREGHEEK